MTISGAEVPAIPDVIIDDPKLRELLHALKTIAEIREGRHIDTGQRFITYYELVDYLRGQDQLVVLASSTGHDHNTLYSLLSHNHALASLSEKSYNSLTDKPTIPVNHSQLTDDEATKHRLINDSGTSSNELWSASKINSELAAVSTDAGQSQAYFFATM